MKKTMINRALIALIFAFTTVSSHAIGLGGWVGYGLSLDSIRDKTCNIATRAGGTCNKGGLSFGGDLWLLGFGPIQLGVGGAYLPIVNIDYSFRVPTTGSLASVESSAQYIPLTAQLRVDIPVLPIFVGAMAGYSFVSSNSTTKVTVNNQPLVISTPSGSDSSGSGAFTIGGFAGYAFKPVPLVSIDAGARVYLVFAEETVVQMVPFIGATFAL